jgi:hypothetical protein
MLAFIKGYLLLSLVCTIIFSLIIKFNSEQYDSNDPIGWD